MREFARFIDRLLDRMPPWPDERQWVTIALFSISGGLLLMAREDPHLWNVKLFEVVLQALVLTGLLNGRYLELLALPDARLLMMLRATHDNKDGLKSSIVWNYGHVTIPRHLRDIVITEYGVADLRGQADSEVIKRLIAVADSRFQDELVRQAKANGKLEAGYELPERYRHNLPQAAWGAGISAFTIIFAVGQIIGPSIVGWIADGAGGLQRGLTFSALMLLAGALVAAAKAMADLQKPLAIFLATFLEEARAAAAVVRAPTAARVQISEPA